EQELRSLETQKNNITGKVAFIREAILQAVGAKHDEIPFVGELIHVKEKAWENSIEKLLHGFALRILVPERYYNKVNNFVNKTDLGGKIVYHKVENKINNKIRKNEDDSLITKIEIKPDSEYFDWVEDFISNSYDYICTDNIEYFSRCSKAITKDGLTKNNSKHEKDDRPEAFRKENFILGWDNKDKVKIQRELLKTLDKQISELDSNITSLEKKKKVLNKEKDDASLFLNFDDFESINWKKIAIEIQALETQKQDLETTSNKIKALNTQLKNVRDELKQKENFLTEKTKDEAKLEDSLLKNETILDDSKLILNKYDKSSFETDFPIFEDFFSKEMLSFNLKNIDDIYKKLDNKLDNSIEKQKELSVSISDNLKLSMREFKNPSDEDLLKKFTDWRTDAYQLSDDIKYVSDYLTILDKLNQDELPKSQERFKKYLNEDMINKLADFQTILTTQEEAIIENVEALNLSLKKINFRNNPPTYIQIKEGKNTSEIISSFKLSLKDWKPNLSEYEKTKNDAILENSFLKIQSIIDDLSANENKRKEVTDVRNWFQFSAREHFREDNKLFKIYESTGELSGGEKAQLTYTILGSSIAYQFGINQDGNESKSFRFITVDESFSNQDDEKATYLMDLCKQLHLQLLVVTPNDKTHIVEPYISHVHFAQRQNNRNSLLFDMPITEYMEEREKYNLAND
ncbi:MAG: SbcC/MukB-like Walker B domain-containing protein, partial [Cyanobacteriota bacterium]